LLGVGNPWRGDDAAGLKIVRALQPALAGRQHLLALETGPAPENFGSVLRRFQPDLVLWIDAADFGEAPGTICLREGQETTGFSASSHTLPPALFGQYLTGELGCHFAILGIQPETLAMGAAPSENLSPPVASAVKQATAVLRSLLLEEV